MGSENADTNALDKKRLYQDLKDIINYYKSPAYLLADIVRNIREGRYDLPQLPTADLVKVLEMREGVEYVVIDHDDAYEVSKSDPFDERFGTLDPVWSGTGPAILIKVID